MSVLPTDRKSHENLWSDRVDRAATVMNHETVTRVKNDKSVYLVYKRMDLDACCGHLQDKQ